MNFETLKFEVESLPVAARRKLMAFMVALEDESCSNYAAYPTEKIETSSLNQLLTLEKHERNRIID